MAINIQTSVLLPYMQEFYYELLRQKEKALRLGEVPEKNLYDLQEDNPDNIIEPMEDHSPGKKNGDAINLAISVQKKLRAVLDEQLKKAALQVGATFTMSNFKDMHFALAALADEVFINLKWNGSRAWRESLLETQLFSTQVSGEVLFAKIDALLESYEPAVPELATIYLFVLSFGFRGKYRGNDPQNRLRWYMDQLYLLANDGVPNLLRESRRHIVESCYDFTMTEPPLRGLPDIRTWGLWIGGVLLVYTFITYVVWYKLSSDIHESLNLIFEQAKVQPIT
jgi:type VI secretion system protein ImpK